MSYGIVIPSITSSTTTPADFRSARLVSLVEVRTHNGSASVPNFDSTKGFFYAKTNVFALAVQKLVWNNTTKIITWSVGGAGTVTDTTWSRNFDILFFESEA